MKLCSERIQEVNPIINSVVDTRFEKALEEARAVDEGIRNSTISSGALKEKKPLLGVPFTIKESVAAEGKLRKIIDVVSEIQWRIRLLYAYPAR